MAEAVRTRVEVIRDLNDAFRKSFVGGLVVLTDGVAALPEVERAVLLRKVRGFSDFTADNDPYGEHDFGSVEIGSARFFWKIDCYDRQMIFVSPDPGDPTATTRVLTVMQAAEY